VPVAADARVRSQARPCDSGTGFSSRSFGFPVSVLMRRTHSFVCHRRCIMSAVDSVVK
jgi:hypothetical protein